MHLVGASQVVLVMKNSSVKAGDIRDTGSIPRSGRCQEKRRQPPHPPYSCLGKSHRQRSLMGYSPLGCEESDMTEAI